MIIAGFAGVGKSTFADKNPDLAIDLESSNYKWIFDSSIKDINVEERKGLCDKIVNPEWPMNYIKAIQAEQKKHDFVLICLDSQVREILREQNIRYYVAFPVEEAKDEYIERYKNRNNGENFVKLMESNFDKWIQDLRDTELNQIRLQKGEFIGDKFSIEKEA